MNNYFVFLDIDNTILDFSRSEASALHSTLYNFGYALSNEMLNAYRKINISCWEMMERGEITKDRVLVLRYERFSKEYAIDVPAFLLNETYEEKLKEEGWLLPGAKELLDELEGKYHLYLASNGVGKTQDRRLELAGISGYFEKIFISERIGAEKPSVQYFDRCFQQIPGFCKERAIMIGDSLSSDILGGKNAGIKTCLYDPSGKRSSPLVKPDFSVQQLNEIPKLLKELCK